MIEEIITADNLMTTGIIDITDTIEEKKIRDMEKEMITDADMEETETNS
jgi:hypothetical protein